MVNNNDIFMSFYFFILFFLLSHLNHQILKWKRHLILPNDIYFNKIYTINVYIFDIHITPIAMLLFIKIDKQQWV